MKILQTSFAIVILLLSALHTAQVFTGQNNLKLVTDVLEDQNPTPLSFSTIADAINDLADKNELKISATVVNKNSLTYNMKNKSNRKLTLKVRRNADSYMLNMMDEKNSQLFDVTDLRKKEDLKGIKEKLQKHIYQTLDTSRRLLVNIGSLKTQLEKDLKDFTLTNESDVLSITKKDFSQKAILNSEVIESFIVYKLSSRTGGETSKSYNTSHHIYNIKIDKDGDDTKNEIILTEFIKSSLQEMFKTETLTGGLCEKLKDQITAQDFTTKVCEGEKKDELELLTLSNNDYELKYAISYFGEKKFRISLFGISDVFNVEGDINFSGPFLKDTANRIENSAVESKAKGAKLKKHVNDLISSTGGCDAYLKTNLEDKGYGYYPASTGDNKDCILKDFDVSIAYQSFMSFFALKIDHPRFLLEQTIGLGENHKETLKNIITDLSAVTETFKPITNGTEQSEMVQISIVDLKGKIIALKPNCEFKENSCVLTKNGMEITVITISQKEHDIILSMTAPPDTSKKGSHAHFEINFKELNGFNQWTAFEKKVKTFIDTVLKAR